MEALSDKGSIQNDFTYKVPGGHTVYLLGLEESSLGISGQRCWGIAQLIKCEGQSSDPQVPCASQTTFPMVATYNPNTLEADRIQTKLVAAS